VLANGLESSVPGLHFIGASAVASFGPLLRFVAGTGFAARTVTRAVLADRRAARQVRSSEERILLVRPDRSAALAAGVADARAPSLLSRRGDPGRRAWQSRGRPKPRSPRHPGVVRHQRPSDRQIFRYATRALAWNGPDAEGAVDWLIDLARRHGLEGWVLFAGGDAEVRLVAHHHAALQSIYRVITPPWETTRWAGDKQLAYRHATSVGVASPWSRFPTDRSEIASVDCRFPVILKPEATKSATPSRPPRPGGPRIAPS